MDDKINILFSDLSSKNDQTRMAAFNALISISENKVDWFENKYDELISKLSDENSYQRSIGVMLLCGLAKSDKNNILRKDLERILEHTRDDKFVTSRQCIQNIWKIAVEDKINREAIINHLFNRFVSCESEKHFNLVRLDTVQSLSKTAAIVKDEELKKDIAKLIDKEKNDKFKEKYKKALNDV